MKFDDQDDANLFDPQPKAQVFPRLTTNSHLNPQPYATSGTPTPPARGQTNQLTLLASLLNQLFGVDQVKNNKHGGTENTEKSFDN